MYCEWGPIVGFVVTMNLRVARPQAVSGLSWRSLGYSGRVAWGGCPASFPQLKVGRCVVALRILRFIFFFSWMWVGIVGISGVKLTTESRGLLRAREIPGPNFGSKDRLCRSCFVIFPLPLLINTVIRLTHTAVYPLCFPSQLRFLFTGK
jgi:hypothetical protein